MHIEKDLEMEAAIKQHVAYIPLAGASTVENFRSPDSFVFIFFEKCKGVHSIDFIEFEENDNQVHISFPGQIHSWKTILAKGHKLIVSKKFIEKNLFNTSFSLSLINRDPIVDVPAPITHLLSGEFMLLKEELNAGTGQHNIVDLRTQLILTYIDNLLKGRSKQPGYTEKRHQAVKKFIDLVEINFADSKSVAFYADKLSITSNYLSILTKRYLKLSAKDLIDARVVLEAKRLLAGSGLSIKEIAYRLGFPTNSSFTAFMITKTGFSPSSYRSKD